jgi:hypothetical protein
VEDREVRASSLADLIRQAQAESVPMTDQEVASLRAALERKRRAAASAPPTASVRLSGVRRPIRSAHDDRPPARYEAADVQGAGTSMRASNRESND